MALIAKSVLSSRIVAIRQAKEVFRADVQEVLVSVAYQAARGNPNWANDLLDAVRDTVNTKPITMWLETFAPLVVKDNAFIINKGMAKEMKVENEADFVQYEVEMRKTNWWTMVKPAKATSIFAADEYVDGAFERMAKTLNKEGQPDLANAIKALLPELYASEAWRKLRDAQHDLANAEPAPV